MKVQDQSAYLLHQRPYRDTSQIVELFSQNYGRISALSRGSRGAKSKIKSVLQPFRPLHVSWSGKGELPTLTSVESASQRIPQLAGHQLASGFYINELLMRLLHRFDVQDAIYHLYEQTLYQLQEAPLLEITLRLFEKNLLQLLGFELNLSSDANSGEQVSETAYYHYQIEHGPVLVTDSVEAQSALLVPGASLLAFDKDELESAEVQKHIKKLMRQVLAFYLEGKPLKSRELFR